MPVPEHALPGLALCKHEGADLETAPALRPYTRFARPQVPGSSASPSSSGNSSPPAPTGGGAPRQPAAAPRAAERDDSPRVAGSEASVGNAAAGGAVAAGAPPRAAAPGGGQAGWDVELGATRASKKGRGLLGSAKVQPLVRAPLPLPHPPHAMCAWPPRSAHVPAGRPWRAQRCGRMPAPAWLTVQQHALAALHAPVRGISRPGGRALAGRSSHAAPHPRAAQGSDAPVGWALTRARGAARRPTRAPRRPRRARWC